MGALLLFAGIGGACGFVTAFLFRRRSLLEAIVVSAVTGTLFLALFFGLGEATADYSQHGYSLMDALRAGAGATILFGMSAPFTGGIPAAFFGYVCHRLFHKSVQKPSA